jgi:hypothetical protein
MEKKSIDFAAIPQTALKVLTSPVSFFREMAKTGGFIEPLVFLVALAVVTAIVDGVLGILGLKFILSVWAALFSIIITRSAGSSSPRSSSLSGSSWAPRSPTRLRIAARHTSPPSGPLWR